MGQSATLYRINKNTFEQLCQDPVRFKPDLAEGRAVFEQNFQGLIFLLNKVVSAVDHSLINEIFYPNDFLGSKEDVDALNGSDGLSFSEQEPIGYLKLEKVMAISDFLYHIDKEQLLHTYDPEEFNRHEVYPRVWHNNESADQAFNKRHLAEGFDELVKLFGEAVDNKNLILAFVG